MGYTWSPCLVHIIGLDANWKGMKNTFVVLFSMEYSLSEKSIRSVVSVFTYYLYGIQSDWVRVCSTTHLLLYTHTHTHEQTPTHVPGLMSGCVRTHVRFTFPCAHNNCSSIQCTTSTCLWCNTRGTHWWTRHRIREIKLEWSGRETKTSASNPYTLLWLWVIAGS